MNLEGLPPLASESSLKASQQQVVRAGNMSTGWLGAQKGAAKGSEKENGDASWALKPRRYLHSINCTPSTVLALERSDHLCRQCTRTDHTPHTLTDTNATTGVSSPITLVPKYYERLGGGALTTRAAVLLEESKLPLAQPRSTEGKYWQIQMAVLNYYSRLFFP